MSATQGLRNKALEKYHDGIRSVTRRMVLEFIARQGYTPPYWEMIRMAEDAQSR